MTDATSKLFAQFRSSQIGASEAFLLASSAILSVAVIAALHYWADVPMAVAILAVLGCISALVAGSALVRRTRTSPVVDERIAELRAEIADLRNARPAAAFGASTVELVSAEDQPPRSAFAETSSGILRPAREVRPTALLPAPSHRSGHDRPRQAEHAAAAVSAMPAPSAQQRVRPSRASHPLQAPIAAVPPGSHSGRNQSAAHEGRAASPASAQPDARTGRPNAYAARIASTAPPASRPSPPRTLKPSVPAADVKAAAAPIDLGAMQAMIEQLATHRQQSSQAERSSPNPRNDASLSAGSARAATAISTSAPASRVATRVPVEAPPFVLEPGSELTSLVVMKNGEATHFGQLTQVSEALEAKRIEVFLNPLVGLADRKARHLELTVRLVAQSGHAFAEDELRRIAAGTGLLARVDAAKLARAVAVLKRFRANGSRVRLFATLAGESLVDENFSGALAELLAGGSAGDLGLVLAVSQGEARAYSEAHWQAATQLWMRGMSFALMDVTDLDIDFELLKSRGFDFIKLDAAVFLEGLPTPGGHVPASDICRHLAGIGLNLILGETVAE